MIWRNIVTFVLNIFKLFGDIGNWLFTPINVNAMAKPVGDFYEEMQDMGLSNFPTWGFKLIENAAEPIYITPIEIFSIGFITTLFIWAVVKNIWSN